MKIALTIVFFFLALSQAVFAQAREFAQYNDLPYVEVRELLIKDGWQVVRNKTIDESSMYAQTLYASQFEEVLDCISMERDQCQFVLAKGKQAIVVTTKDKTFTVESIKKAKLQ